MFQTHSILLVDLQKGAFFFLFCYNSTRIDNLGYTRGYDIKQYNDAPQCDYFRLQE